MCVFLSVYMTDIGLEAAEYIAMDSVLSAYSYTVEWIVK